MPNMVSFRALLLVLSCMLTCVQPAKILILFPFQTRSENNVIWPLAEGLAERGHELTLITVWNRGKKISGIEEHNLASITPSIDAFFGSLFDSGPGSSSAASLTEQYRSLKQLVVFICDETRKNAAFQEYIQKKRTADLIIMTPFFSDCVLPIVDVQKAPFIYFSTPESFSRVSSATGFSEPPSFCPETFLPFTDKMDLWQRMINLMVRVHGILVEALFIGPVNREKALEIFGPDVAQIEDIHYNVSMAFQGSATGTSVPRPSMPQLVSVGGMNIKEPKPLPKYHQTHRHAHQGHSTLELIVNFNWLAMKSTILCFLAILAACNAASVLFVLPVSTNSHKNVFMPLAKALASRGHEVTFVSSRLSKKPVSGVVEYAVPTLEERMTEGAQTMWKQMGQASVIGAILTMYFLSSIGAEACDLMYGMPELKPFLNGEKHVDLVIQSEFFQEACLGFAGTLKAPYIYVSTAGNWPQLADAMGFTEVTSVTPSLLLTHTNRMSFFQRVQNTLIYHSLNLMLKVFGNPKHDDVLKKHLGSTVPSVDELHHNASMAFLNTIPGMDYPGLLPPNMKEVGGMHCVPPNLIPKDLEEWVTGSKDGFIYFSLGSAVQGKLMPEKYRKMFVEAFSRLPQYRILWKWETEQMDDLPKNVKLSKWLPQQDLLGHKDIKLFITHGGLLSTQESTYHGVPVVGIPIGADQMLNMKKTEMEGAGLTLEWSNLSTDRIHNAILRVLDDPSFKENLKRRSAIMRDQPETPLERAVFWTEYVIRHKGASHLRSAARELTWYQYHLIDVWLFIALVVGLLLFSIFFAIRTCFRCVFGRKAPRASGQRDKQD